MLRSHTRVIALLAGALLLGACRDEPTAPLAAESSTPRFAAGGKGNGNGNGPSSLDLIEDDYAGGLLDKENANRYREYAVSAPEKLPQKYQSSERGKDATYSMVQMAQGLGRRSPPRRRKEIQDLRANGFGNLKGTRRDDALRAALHDAGRLGRARPWTRIGNGYPDFIDAAAKSWEEIYAREVGQLGYPAPEAGVDRRRRGGQQVPRLLQGHAVLRLLRARERRVQPVNGFPSGTASAWIVVENDFVRLPAQRRGRDRHRDDPHAARSR